MAFVYRSSKDPTFIPKYSGSIPGPGFYTVANNSQSVSPFIFSIIYRSKACFVSSTQRRVHKHKIIYPGNSNE